MVGDVSVWEDAMMAEVLGFICGIVAISAGWAALVRFERWKAVRAAYGLGRSQGGNALIWPSR